MGGRALTNGTGVVIKDTPQSSLRPPSCEDTVRNLQPEREPSPDHVGIVISDFQLPELPGINFRCLSATQSVFFCYSSPARLRQ